MKKNRIKAVLKPRKKQSRKKSRNGCTIQPPKNMITVKVLIKMIEPYSAKKNNAKPILAYSTLNPETNSDSASGKSKGARFVSAKIETNHIIKRGKQGTANKTLY
jgi:hypothetical protein